MHFNGSHCNVNIELPFDANPFSQSFNHILYFLIILSLPLSSLFNTATDISSGTKHTVKKSYSSSEFLYHFRAVNKSREDTSYEQACAIHLSAAHSRQARAMSHLSIHLRFYPSALIVSPYTVSSKKRRHSADSGSLSSA